MSRRRYRSPARASSWSRTCTSRSTRRCGGGVGEIGKVKGWRVVGIAGGPEKCEFLVTELGFDAAIDYKNDNMREALKQTCPDRVDVYFDNVGGDILNTLMTRLARGARII